ncbi:MAG: serine hydrolase domain-containing protein [Pseudomonadota bacterium]
MGTNSQAAEPVEQYEDARSEAFRAYLADFRKEKRIPSLSAVVVKDGEILFEAYLGYQDHDAEEPTTDRTSYLVASITKTFTAATLLGMDQDGHIDLDADFTTLSDWPGRCEWLAGSGIIFGGGTLDDGRPVESVDCETSFTLRDVLQHRVQAMPGTGFFYNPVVFGRLSNWAEENTDKSWRDWMRRYVIEPGGLDSIAAGWRDAEGVEALTHLAPPFRHDSDRGDRPVPSPLPNPELNASSGIIASARDLADYSIAVDNGSIMKPELREAMWTPPINADGTPSPHAHGWFVQNWEGHRLVWHGGWWPDAYAGLLLKAPDDDLALILLSNGDNLRADIDTLTKAEIHKAPMVAKFLELFLTSDN